ncbi:MAG: HNH endonuclease [Candidatus Poribacteria bacterium]|nr:HNH endonuclease [Candidatus Poribacteria bacterium]
MPNNILQKYIQKMERLRIDRARGAAPNKPLLLLAIIELIEQGQIPENRIVLSPDLAEAFLKYWTKVTDRKPNIAMPFFHLKSEGFWHLHANSGYETALSVASQLKTASRIREVIASASFDDELFFLLTNAHDREVIRQTLIDTYFTDFKTGIESLITEKQQVDEYRQALLQQVKQTFSSLQPLTPTEEDNPIRTAGFRQAIMRIYDYTCAACQLRIVTMDGESVTEAAHIIPFKVSGNNDVRNGISLCQLHHWAFDVGLISLGKTYEVIVSELMSERGPTEWLLTTLRGKSILLPEHNELYPAQEALTWHREEVFRQ